MRILMLCWELPPALCGGLGVACEGIVEALAKKKHALTVLTPFESPLPIEGAHMIGAADLLGRSLFTIAAPYSGGYGYSRRIAAAEEISGPDRLDAARAVDALYGPGLPVAVSHFERAALRLARQQQFDVVHCHDWMTVPAGVSVREHLQIPLLYHIHSLEHDRVGNQQNGYIVNTEEFGIRHADRLISVSSQLRLGMLRDSNVIPERVVVVHNAVPTDVSFSRVSRQASETRNIVLLGRVTWQKDPGLFLDAAAQVVRRVRNVRFIMAGTGDLLDDMKRHAQRLGIGRYVEFRGHVPRHAVPELLQETDVLVMSSRHEPFGLTALEAAAAGIPLVVPHNAGVREVLPEAAGFTAGCADELAEEIVHLLCDASWGRKVVQRNHEHAGSWTWADAAEVIEGIYATITDHDPTSPRLRRTGGNRPS